MEIPGQLSPEINSASDRERYQSCHTTDRDGSALTLL
jgi:hypothetical protein